jgi:hypothetical protein
MKTQIDQLKDVLRFEIELSEKLLGVLKSKQMAVVHQRLAELSTCVHKEQEMLVPIANASKERAQLVRAILLGYNPSNKNPREMDGGIEAVLEHLKDPDRQSLSALVVKLRATANEILAVNTVSVKLIEHSLRFVRENVRVLTENFSRKLVDQKV